MNFWNEHGYPITEQYLANEILKKLSWHYPGWTWMININAEKTVGTVSIMLMELLDALRFFRLSNEPTGAIVHLNKLYNDASLKKIIQVGGYLLEFAKFPQKRPDDFSLTIKDMFPFLANKQNYELELMQGLR